MIKVYKYLDEHKKFDSQIAQIKLDELIQGKYKGEFHELGQSYKTEK